MEKYPELEDFTGDSTAQDGDLASREKALLGDDAAEFGGAVPEDTSVDEAEFQSNYPALDAEEPETATNGTNGVTSEYSEAATPVSEAAYDAPDLGESQFIKDWKVKNELEIERRDKASAAKQAETREKAQKAIDDFYENYNSKKDKGLSSTRDEADSFIKARDEALGGSTWDHAARLIDGASKPIEGVKPADKTRFKELVDSLKGDANAPGAAGY